MGKEKRPKQPVDEFLTQKLDEHLQTMSEGIEKNPNYASAVFEAAQVRGNFSPDLIRIKDGDLDPAWIGKSVPVKTPDIPAELRRLIQPGDEVHEWHCEPRTAHLLSGAAGYALLRNKNVVEFETTTYIPGIDDDDD